MVLAPMLLEIERKHGMEKSLKIKMGNDLDPSNICLSSSIYDLAVDQIAYLMLL